jgi:hypothetical protein
MSLSKADVAAHVERYGCFCGGDGEYDDYNCGAQFSVTCPHCRGTGKKKCSCETVSLQCNSPSRVFG